MAYFNDEDEDQFSFDQTATPPTITATPMTSFQAAPAPMATSYPDTPSFEGMDSAPHEQPVDVEDFSYGGAAAAPWTSTPTSTGAGGQPGASPSTPSASTSPDFRSMMQSVQNATDPTQRAVAQDALARSLFATFKDAGHDVKWQGDNLIVDGRAYVVGAGTYAPPNGNTGVTGYGPGGLPVPGTTGSTETPPPANGFAGYPGSGWDETKWNDPNSDSAKYIVGRTMAALGDQIRAIPDEAGRKAFLEQQMWGLAPTLAAKGWTVKDVNGDKAYIEGHGEAGWVDYLGDMEGAATPSWSPDDTGGPAPTGPTRFAPLPIIDRQPIGAGGTPVNRPSGPATVGDWTPSAPTYEPGDVPMDDVPTYSFEDLLARMQTPEPGRLDTNYAAGSIRNAPLDLGRVEDQYQPGQVRNTPLAFRPIDESYDTGTIGNAPLDLGRVEDTYQAGRVSNQPLNAYSFEGFDDLGAMGGGPVDPETEAAIRRELANPESLGTQQTDTLKAKNKDEIAEQQALEEENLRAMGGRLGVEESPWLASERLASKRNRDLAVVKGNRDIDIEAARTNTADRRAAAELGMSYASNKAGRNLAERGQRFTEATAGENLKNLSVESQTKAAQFAREGEAMNESLRAQAAQLRQAGQTANANLLERAARFGREGEMANADLRKAAADFRQRGETANADLLERAATFSRQGETLNEQLRAEAADRRMRGQTTNAGLRAQEATFGREGELANEQLRGQAFDRRNAATQANIDNAFKSAEDKRAAVALAADTTLKAAAAKGDRIALREAIKQKATELGQSADKVRLDYTLGVIDDATRRYGIDVGASIDREKLAQAGREFQEDLAFRIAALAQADRQFGAQYGIDLGRYQRDLDNDAWARYNDSMSYEG
jgi:hypothetical protein